MWPNRFIVKINMRLLPWIKVAQNFGPLLYFSKKLPREELPNRRKFAPSGHPGSKWTGYSVPNILCQPIKVKSAWSSLRTNFFFVF
jgi:hypothetical protein